MTEDEITEKREELLSEHWTEDLHHSLRDLHPDVARRIIDTMDDSEIYVKVNHRRFQEDYIAEYLNYLWDISKEAFWRHTIVSLDPEVGILWGGDMPHFEKMCKNPIPKEVLEAVIHFLIHDKNKIEQDTEAIGCVLRAQAKRFNQLDEIKNYVRSLNLQEETEILNQIEQLIETEPGYSFY
ncbi:hypothetical protein [Flavobacterium sp.]|uniref:hypothetical protein n=1 Tax=Flavobacterium sp. TaxID=239 RepID=UPI0025C5DEC9|nr:hypothetical protein [Flavobacterium sp.]